MQKINFEDGVLIEGAYVTINGVNYPVQMPVYDGEISLSAQILNQMQDNIEEAIDEGTVLYDGETYLDFTLNETITNYSTVEVFFHETMSNTYSSRKCKVVPAISQTPTKIELSTTRVGSTYIYIFATNLSLNGTSATFASVNKGIYFATDLHNVNDSTSGRIVVDKVVGYKHI